MSDTPLPNERTITTSSGEEVSVRETITDVRVTAGSKRQREQYEPIEEQVTLEASKPSEIIGIDSDCTLSRSQFDEWLEALADIAWAEAERGVAARIENHIRNE